MFLHPDLDSDPPQPQFRRPWSPEINVPPASSSMNALRDLQQENDFGRAHQNIHSNGASPPHQAQREASDVSVEALDLADYSRTLRARQAEDPYPPFPSQLRQSSNAPSSFPSLIPGAGTTDFLPLSMPVPSLVSRGPTLSSSPTHRTFSSTPRSVRRPFSLPPAPLFGSQAISSRARFNGAPTLPYSNPQNASSEGIDISHFPKWSRNWYSGQNSSANLGYPGVEVDGDIYIPVPPSQFLSTRNGKSIFDPGYVHDPFDASNLYDLPHPPLSSVSHNSREVLPWSNDPVEYGPTVDPMLKEERMRMLEREFGEKAKDNRKDFRNALVDEDGKLLLGTIDEKGHLITAGPKRRVVLRILQVMLAGAACIPAIYAALVIKATDPTNPPPPASKPPAFILYILSSITLLVLFYMFIVRPCCLVRSKAPSKHPFGNPANMGMMVLPVGQAGDKKKKPKPGKKGNGKYGPPGVQDVQVNLIVDPMAFQPPEASDEEDDEEDEETIPGGYGPYDNHKQKERRKRRNCQRRRRGVFEGLAMEEQWRLARTWAKKVTMVDVAGLVLWGAAFVFIMTGKKCPSGGFNGWCNAYNVSTASACLLAVSFGVGTFFDVQDLHASKESPRTRC
ncbi:hypothetical protein BDN70DRAFT_881102 [Pholiota conissans]|uniref:Uncharacterized protein n=1 Tax=Pholiota conissans TaxID=109636 RepID=A0A9P6CSN9_9AGAR|nr:hypothetical protein BDN70DRAFT_881102 [Pholiota conissans]